MSRVILFLNGQAPGKFPDLNQFAKVFCTDGAYRYLKANNITPDVVSGDFDSISAEEVPAGIEVIITPDQNFTDFEKALNIIEQRGFKEVYIYGSSGMEHDHFLGNLATGVKYKDKLTLIFFDDFSYYFFADKKTILEDYKGRTISLYPFPFANGIITKGLKYALDNEDLDLTYRVGTRNKGTDDLIEIEFREGNLLIFIKIK